MNKEKKPMVAIKTFGCKVNQYESEVILEDFKKNGYISVKENEFANVYIINTCTVTKLSDKKARQYIRRVKRINPQGLICVVGCYAQISPEEVANIEGVDIIAGTGDKLYIYDFVKEKLENLFSPGCYIKPYEELTEFIDTGTISAMESRTRAYIKIQEGCNQFCSYCIIPYARGKIRSRTLQSIVDEVEILLKEGFKEIVLTGINTALYGREASYEDRDKNPDGILGLLRLIDNISGDFRIRLSSLEPTVVNAEYVKELFNIKKLCHHLHLSIQSGSDEILHSMKRHYNRNEYLNIVDTLRGFDEDYGITTDIIVGFPGETRENFEDTVNIVSRVKFAHCHIFPYSDREGTLASNMDNKVPGNIKNERMKKLLKIGEEQEKIFRKRLSGKKQRVLFEEYVKEADSYRGYSDNYIKCYLKSSELKKQDISPAELLNNFAEVEITECTKDGVSCVLLSENIR